MPPAGIGIEPELARLEMVQAGLAAIATRVDDGDYRSSVQGVRDASRAVVAWLRATLRTLPAITSGDSGP